MKKIFILMAAVISLLSACSKDDCPAPPPDVKRFAGTYTGTGTAVTGQSGAITIRLDSAGTSVITYPPLSLTGTWAIDGTVFRSSNISNQASLTFAATISADEKTITGTFGQGAASTGGGTFTVTKP
jgi:hypothetical protein